MHLWEAGILGIVEGLTEFLPVSSTGHLILTSAALGTPENSGAFEIVIQAGAILAVLWHYRTLFWKSLLGLCQRQERAWRFWLQVLVAFFPAVILGLTWGSWIKAHLFGVLPVAAALVVGGVLMIGVEKRHPLVPDPESADEIEDLPLLKSFQQALFIGVFQCLALWPGTSRSMSTILGGRLLGLSPKKAAEFSFWLAIPTLIGASLYDALKHRHELFQDSQQVLALIVGTVVSFFTGLIVIRVFLKFLQTHSLEIFGWYRIVLGLVVAVYALWML